MSRDRYLKRRRNKFNEYGENSTTYKAKFPEQSQSIKLEEIKEPTE